MTTPDPEFLRCMECVLNGVPYTPTEETKDNTPKGTRELIDLVVDEETIQPLDNEESELNSSLDVLKINMLERKKEDLSYGSPD